MASKRRKVAQVYQDSAGGWRWRVRAENGRIVQTSGEAYRTRGNALDAVARMFDSIIDRSLAVALADALRAAGRIG